MILTLYNTATKKLEEFTPLRDGHVSLYTCGPTVYDYPHVGNWTAYIYWDILVRTLLANGYEVERVINITDVGHLVSDDDEGEDKLEKGARREGKTAWQIAEYYTEDFMNGMEKLGLIMPEHLARATDYILEQLNLVRTLKAKGYTYQISDGIYFDTAKFPRYANFAGLNLDELKAGARIEVNREKRNSSDFALWKFTPKNTNRDMEWETPKDILDDSQQLLMGFPGWHLECSAIAMNFLGPTLDIHTGGIDHIPVHHTNEIAQSEAATGQQFSGYWLHNNHLKVDGTKISKSLGNGFTLQNLEEKGFSPLDYRLFVLQSHYGSEGNFTFEALNAAKNRRTHWRSVAALRWQLPAASKSEGGSLNTIMATSNSKIREALDFNLNTPEALRLADEAFSAIESRPLSIVPSEAFMNLLQTIDELLGLQLINSTPDIDTESKQLILERTAARNKNDWEASDNLRLEIAARGLTIRDTAEGAVWSYAD